jgi:hypothetical protein
MPLKPRPAIARQTNEEYASDMLEDLRNAADSIKHLRFACMDTVLELRALGVTWTKIGDALGVTRQAAQQRFDMYAYRRRDPPGQETLLVDVDTQPVPWESVS